MGGSCESVLVLSGSCSVLRRKEGHTCTCLSTLLLMSSKVDMAATWREPISLSTAPSLHRLTEGSYRPRGLTPPCIVLAPCFMDSAAPLDK